MFVTSSASAGSALVMTLGAVHRHVRVMRESHLAEARRKGQLGGSRFWWRSSSSFLDRFLRVASTASLRPSAHLLMASRATSGTGRGVADLLERETGVSGIMLVASGARAVSALVMTLDAAHGHVGVMRESNLACARRKCHLAFIVALGVVDYFRRFDNSRRPRRLCFSLMTGHAINRVFVLIVDLARH